MLALKPRTRPFLVAKLGRVKVGAFSLSGTRMPLSDLSLLSAAIAVNVSSSVFKAARFIVCPAKKLVFLSMSILRVIVTLSFNKHS